jgi:serine/threonine protein kinase
MLEKIPFAGWTVKEKIGFGGFCSVYRVEKDGYNSAVKQIIIPGDKEYMGALSRFDGNEREFYKYYDPEKNKMLKEIEILRNLRGIPGIVIYQDHIVRRYEKRHGFEILILMEYLQPLDKYVLEKGIKVKQVLKMIVEICSSLDACHKENILHRDIKEGNIFVDKRENFKIGDFGISKVMEGLSHVSTRAGTKWYMAPEVYKGEKYDYRADIYSLGLVMYKLLNDNLLPFMKKKATISDDEIAKDKIINGEVLPKPYKADDEIYGIILKACNYDKNQRYNSFREMGESTKNILENSKNDLLNTYAVYPIKKYINKNSETSLIKLDNLVGHTMSYKENINKIYDSVHKSLKNPDFMSDSEKMYMGDNSIKDSIIRVLTLSRSKMILVLLTIIVVLGIFLAIELNNIALENRDFLNLDKDNSIELDEADADRKDNSNLKENNHNDSSYSDIETYINENKDITPTLTDDNKENEEEKEENTPEISEEVTDEPQQTTKSTNNDNTETPEISESPEPSETENTPTPTQTLPVTDETDSQVGDSVKANIANTD